MSELTTLMLPLVWAAILAFAVFMYVLLDGFDLGIGILFPFAPSAAARGRMMDSVAPVWDANETWLVLGGGGLLAAFPLAYGILLPAFYLPVILMLLGLILRGLMFEFRHHDPRHQPLWDICFAAGSTLAAFMQGMMVGAFVGGIKVENGAFAGSPLDWITPYSILTGIGLVIGYALLGAGWLIIKMDGSLADWARMVARKALLATATILGLVSVLMPLNDGAIAARWFDGANLLMLSPLPLLTIAAVIGAWRALGRNAVYIPFVLALGIFALSYLGLAVSLFPYMVPRSLTLWQTAANESSLMLYGLIPLLPLILGYTGYSYYVFRGKTRASSGYH